MYEDLDNPGGDLNMDNMDNNAGENVATATTDLEQTGPAQSFNDYEILGSEDDGVIDVEDNWVNALESDPRLPENQHLNTQTQEEDPENEDPENEEEDQYDFDIDDILDDREEDDEINETLIDETIAPKPSNNITVEEAINLLKEKGIKVETPTDLNAERQTAVSNFSKNIEYFENVLNLPEETFIKTAVENMIAAEWGKGNRQHEIGTDEFKFEVQNRIDRLNADDGYKYTFIENQKRNVQDFIGRQRTELDKIQNQILQEKETELVKLKTERVQSIKKLAQEHRLSLKETKEINRFMQSDEYKSLVNNSDFIAQSVFVELARRKGMKLFAKEDNYARGVNETIEAIKNNDTGKASSSQLGNQMRGTNSLKASPEDLNPWLAFNRGAVTNKNDNGYKNVAG